jgi:hypothetical protein
VGAADASRVLPPAGLAMDSRDRVDIGSRARPYECTSSVVGGTVVHQPAIAIGNHGNAGLHRIRVWRAIPLSILRCDGLFFEKLLRRELPFLPVAQSSPVTLGMQLIRELSILQGIMVYILGNPPLDNASTGSGSPEAIAFVLQYPVQTLSFLLRRQNYAPFLQTLA